MTNWQLLKMRFTIDLAWGNRWINDYPVKLSANSRLNKSSLTPLHFLKNLVIFSRVVFAFLLKI